MRTMCLLVLCLVFPAACNPAEEPSVPDNPARRKLPPPFSTGTMSVEEAIRARRSIRSFADQPLTDEALSQLLFSAQGITEPRRGLRAVPSAGATYPLDLYLLTADGVFRYIPADHTLESVSTADRRKELAAACLGQSFVARAGAVFAIAAVPARTSRRYGGRAMMYIHMEAGHAAQNLHLQAVALKLGSVPVGAFDDAAVARILGLDGVNTIPLYIVPVGVPQ